MTVAVIDSGGANLGSVVYALERLDAPAVLTRDAETILAAERVILPGVGAAGWAMDALRRSGLDTVIDSLTTPVLGICLGLQLLFEASEEGGTDCLGILPGRVTALPGHDGLRLPHMGWNQVAWSGDESLARGLDGSEWFYFVHRYAAPATGAVAVTEHGATFAAVVGRANFAAVQFHPERSGPAGARLLENFLAWNPACD